MPGADLLDTYILGAKAKTRLTEDQKLFREMERRRKYDMERRTRLFDGKVRTIGIDKDALDAQVLEKQRRRQEELMHERREDMAFMATGRILNMAEVEKQRERRMAERDCKDFSIKHLSAEQRREFDINDPRILRNTVPDRTHDYDPRCGPASMQRFEGEDLNRAERLRQQHADMAAALEQQKFEQAHFMRSTNPTLNGEAARDAEVCELANEMERQNAMLRREAQENLRNAHLQQASDDVMRRQRQAEEEQMKNAQELGFHGQDHFLNECTPAYHGARVRRDMFKGSNRDQRVEAARDIVNQANQQYMDRQQDSHQDRMLEHENEKTRKLVLRAEREKAQSRRQAAMAMAAENQALAKEQKAANIHRAQLYTNKYGDEFWDQFNTQIR